MIENQFYHIYNRGNNRENIFLEEKNYSYFLEKFVFYLKDQVNVYSYCLMPNHFHFLLKVTEYKKTGVVSESESAATKKLSPLEKSFKDFFISYAKSINKSYDRTGSLFEYKFKRKLITKDSYLQNIVAYIHLNLVRAGLSKNMIEWKHSSFGLFKEEQESILRVDIAEVLNWFNGMDNFIEFHNIRHDFTKERDLLFG
ncbi:MAG: transposase [Ignavibacteria bacterium]|nr:transposase [Ignavibacteria bacterium]